MTRRAPIDRPPGRPLAGIGERATIRDVAARAGMSTLTVSRVLNNNPSIKASTRERVEAAMRELNYEPSAAAQNIRRGSTRSIGFLMPDFAHGVSAIVAQNVERVLHAAGYTIMLGCSHFDPETECRVLTAFERNRVDAVMLKTCDEGSERIAQRIASMSCPVILVDRDLPVAVDAVVSDHAAAMHDAVLELARLGHRRIGLVAPSRKMRPGRERVAGYLRGMAAAGLPVVEGHLIESGTADAATLDAVSLMLAAPDRPTALIAGGNRILYGVLEALKRHGLTFPRDISLVGADHPSLGRVMNPPITMIDRQPELLAEAAADTLLRRLADPAGAAPVHRTLASRIIPGESCRPLTD